jgi:hypothetical protein
VKHGLPWRLPQLPAHDLVACIVSQPNIMHMQVLYGNVCPRVLFMEMPMSYKKFTIAFSN